ncbi:MAG: threonine synthase, partial [Candidatus Eremiobacteraeota bacterium]|nr:threonine synthase [Candidatus Eremiobacteraeota bacterium]
ADVVCVLTGHVLKDTAYAGRYHASDAPLANAIVRGVDLADYLDRLLATRA